MVDSQENTLTSFSKTSNFKSRSCDFNRLRRASMYLFQIENENIRSRKCIYNFLQVWREVTPGSRGKLFTWTSFVPSSGVTLFRKQSAFYIKLSILNTCVSAAILYQCNFASLRVALAVRCPYFQLEII